MPRRISESAEDVCDVCSEAITIFAIGKCDHPVCLRCSTRLRVLIDDMTCPICRTELPQVVFLKSRKLFEKVLWQKFKFIRKYTIYFEDPAVEDVFKKLLEHQCPLCPDRPPDRGFMQMKTHMSKEHSLYYCDICVEHLKVFSGERRYYSRPELARHRRVGDANDTSHKGHPLCEFCDERYLDNDELLRHLRKEHYYCHFCDQDGSNQYYSDYEVLREHFLKQHYLCQEEDCARAQFTNAFKSLIDLKGHQAHQHAGGLKKGQIKQNRHLDIEINLAPRGHINKSGRRERGMVTGDDFDEVGKGRGRGRGQGGERGRGSYRHDRRARRDDDDDDDVRRGIAASLAENQKPEGGGAASEPDPDPLQVTSYSDDFPTIGASASNAPVPLGGSTMANRFARDNKMSVKESGEVDDFPELPTSRELQQHAKKVPVHGPKVWEFTHTPETKKAPSVGIQNASKKKPGGMDFKVPKEAQIVEKVEEFPALPSSGKSEPARQVTAPPQRPTPAPAKPVSKPELPFNQPPLAVVAAKPANVYSTKPTLSSIGNLLTSGEKPRGNVAAVGKSRTYISSGNTPSLASDSDFPSLGGGYQATKVDSWVANAKDPVQPSPNISLIQSKTKDFPEPASNTKQATVQSYNTNAFKDDEDFPSLGGGGVQMPATWVTQGKVSNRIKQKPLNVKPVVTAGQRQKAAAAAKPKKNEGPPPSNLEGLLSTPDPVKPQQNAIAEDSEFITVVSKPKKKPEPEVATETKQGKKKKKKKGKGNKDAKEEGKENSDDLVIGYALATLEDAEKKPEEPEMIPEADFRMGGEEKTKSKGKSRKEKKQAEKVMSVAKESCQDAWTSVPKESPEYSWTEVKREPERESPVDHVKVISNKNLSNVEKLAHMNNFSLLEEVEDIPEEEPPKSQSKGTKKNNKVPDFNSDDFPALGGGSRRPNSWMEKPRDYSSVKSQKNVKETSPFSVTMPDSNVPSGRMPGLQINDFPSLENIAKYPSMPSPATPPGLPVSRSFAAEDSKPFKPPPGFVSGGSLSAIASSLGGAPVPKAPAPPKPLKMTYQYAQPPDFQERNRKLIFEFHNLLSSPQEFDEFKFLSGQFRQGLTSAQQYYTDCVSLMGADRFMVVFPELLVLLPDIDKQKELNDAFKSCKKNSFMKKQELHVQTCSTCRQVLTQKDFDYHICIPDLPKDFPTL
ncbi:E3 ubiquitin-protein ligase ZNF598-like [Lineus longissimus]|uniref:E3 ubiquitin-protein ligase ZNF598-like n=1 Tax=Lineus longissimus TaxID=88925 RepID=UPI002B4D2978